MGMFLRRGVVRKGMPIGEFPVGTAIKLNVGGTPWEFLIVNQGLPGDIYAASCDGAWLLMKDIYENRRWNSGNRNDYENSTIAAYLNSEFLALLDSDIQSAIKQAKIPYRAGAGYSTTVTSGADGLPAKIFLLSAAEAAFQRTGIPNTEGSTLTYFSGCAANSTDAKRAATLNGSASVWWLRSPYCDYNSGSIYAMGVTANGNSGRYQCTGSQGIRPAFILPTEFLVTDDMLA